MKRELTGKHVLGIFLGIFGVVATANFFMAYSAVSTFPGLEVQNSYVASQQFDELRAAQEALEWTVEAQHEAGILTLSFTDHEGAPVELADLEATVGRATHELDDVEPEFRFDGEAYFAAVPLGNGNWNIRMKARAEDGTLFQQRVVLFKE